MVRLYFCTAPASSETLKLLVIETAPMQPRLQSFKDLTTLTPVTDIPCVLYPTIQTRLYPNTHTPISLQPDSYIFVTGLFTILMYNSYLLVINLNVYIYMFHSVRLVNINRGGPFCSDRRISRTII